MQTFWANVRTTAGGDFIRVTVQAPNPIDKRNGEGHDHLRRVI
jgi:hypothetical protein